jgi:hypothetical protein
MDRTDDRLEQQLDRAIDGIREETGDPAAVDEAAARVLGRLSAELGADTPGTIRSCADYQALIPAYLRGELIEARALLLEDHSRECIPCRRALHAARSARVEDPSVVRSERTQRGALRVSPWRWAAAAAVLLGVTFATWWTVNHESGSPIEIASVAGSLFRITPDGPLPIGAGDVFQGGERIRTGRDSGAIVALADGSTIEMNQRSEIRVTERRDDATIHLARGSIIVEASDQGSGHLFVRTDDCLVSVTGTVFSVLHGSRGSRVSVIEGEVEVDSSDGVEIVQPGQQVVTGFVFPIPIGQEISWSVNLDDHLAMLKELSELQHDLAQLPIPGRRYSTGLLDRAPEGTVVYIGLPNFSETLAEAHRIVREKVATSATLKKWWDENIVATGVEPQLADAIERMRQIGAQLGDEIVVTLQDGADHRPNPVVLAELADPGRFRQVLAAEVERLEARSQNRPPIRVVEDPFAPIGPESDAELLISIQGKLLVAAPKIDALQHMASLVGTPGSSRFLGSPFHQALAETYRDGVSIVFGADLQAILRNDADKLDREDEILKTLGVLDVEHIIVERHEAADRTVTRASVTFDETRRGLAAWLAEPAPMGALDFVSADATAATAFVVKKPAALLEELFNALGQVDSGLGTEVERARSESGLDLLQDIAGPLGGEIALALDGPVLPKPAWKLVAEVYDQAAMQFALELVVGRLNEIAAREGRSTALSIANESIGGRTYYTVTASDIGISIHYTYDDGYMIVAPERGLLDRAVQYRRSGYTLATSPRFTALLPEDGRAHFSAIYYQNIGPVLNPILQSSLAKSAPLTPEQSKMLDELATESRPSLFYAYAEPDRIVIGGSDKGGLFGTNLGSGFQLSSIFGLQETLRRAAESRHVQYD